MRRLFVVATVALSLLPACGGGSGLGQCDFENPINSLRAQPGATPKPLTNETIDDVVRRSPQEIQPDVRIILETGKALNERGKELEALPPAERARKAEEIARVVDTPEFRTARRNYENYLKEHCR